MLAFRIEPAPGSCAVAADWRRRTGKRYALWRSGGAMCSKSPLAVTTCPPRPSSSCDEISATNRARSLRLSWRGGGQRAPHGPVQRVDSSCRASPRRRSGGAGRRDHRQPETQGDRRASACPSGRLGGNAGTEDGVRDSAGHARTREDLTPVTPPRLGSTET